MTYTMITRLLALPWTVFAIAVQRAVGDVMATEYARRMLDMTAQS